MREEDGEDELCCRQVTQQAVVESKQRTRLPPPAVERSSLFIGTYSVTTDSTVGLQARCFNLALTLLQNPATSSPGSTRMPVRTPTAPPVGIRLGTAVRVP